jgi:hypothetical protein
MGLWLLEEGRDTVSARAHLDAARRVFAELDLGLDLAALDGRRAGG